MSSHPQRSTATTLAENSPTLKKQLIIDIAKKKELHTLPLEVIKTNLDTILKGNPKLAKSALHEKSKNYKQLIKLTREQLRRNYGLFRSQNITSISSKIEFYFQNPSLQLLQEILTSHQSTKERLPLYPQLYHEIFKITGEPHHIIDLACGLNPLSIAYFNKKINKSKTNKFQNNSPSSTPHIVTYHAYDINTVEIGILNEYFHHVKKNILPLKDSPKQNKDSPPLKIQYPLILGQAHIKDITTPHEYPPSDVALLFKALDIIDRGKGHKNSEQLLTSLNSKYIIASFATKTMSGKPMTAPKRRWMEWLCKRKSWEYHLLKYETEIFYIIKK